MNAVQRIFAVLLGAGLVAAGTVSAADRERIPNDERQPDERGIWAAIAYSIPDGRHGFFWGADMRRDATGEAMAHCRILGGESCKVIATFRNYRHENDEPEGEVPFQPCGSLAVAKDDKIRSPAWGVGTGDTAAAANDLALAQCEKDGGECSVREWVCT